MTNPILSITTYQTGQRFFHMYCPGCELVHHVTDGSNGWEWNGDESAPTFSPSILVRGGDPDRRCHSFVRGGLWEFLDDCSHALAGQRIPLPPLPDWHMEQRRDMKFRHRGAS